MYKRWIAAVLTVCMAVCFTACKKEKEGYEVEVIGPEKTSAPTVEQSQPGTAPTATPKPQAGFTVGPVEGIEIVASLADYSAPTQNGMSLEERQQLAFFTQNGKTGVIDLEGNVVVPEEKDVHWCPVCGITNGDESEIYNAKGEVIGSGGHGAFEMVVVYDQESKALYYEDMGVLIPWDPQALNTLEPVIVAVVTVTATTTEDANWQGVSLREESNPVLVNQTGGYMLFKPDGTALNGQVYEQIQRASTGTFAVKQNGLWGYVNQETGEEMIPCQYLEALPFNGDRAAVKGESGWGYISLTGRQKTSMEFLGAASAAAQSTAWVKTNAGWGVITLDDYPPQAN